MSPNYRHYAAAAQRQLHRRGSRQLTQPRPATLVAQLDDILDFVKVQELHWRLQDLIERVQP